MAGRKRKSRPLLRLVQLVSLLIFCLALFAGYEITRPLHIPDDRVYALEQGQNVADFARRLAEDGYVRNNKLVLWTARLGRIDRKFKAGEYRFSSDDNLLDVLDDIVNGKSVVHSIQFIEGWTFEDFLEKIRSTPNIDHTLADAPYEAILDTLQITQDNPEGWFFPDTYNYNSGQSDAVILDTAYENMRQNLETEWENRHPDLPYKTAYEGLIVASIIQKESSVISEYPIIAGVIVNRLRKRMRLQMDPTVIYGLAEFNGVLRKSHLETDTPYNTYTRYGLPPTPIAMPGLDALRAAANPADTSALYFVAQGDGTHKFSDTIDEHIKAVREYREKIKVR
ncbi:MAG: endolytic transglycosylase MltG [Acidiferrobacterales bacterium]|nr:endolytic transglycosylase MltG [Acidiferrobacterales bacterium]